MTAEHILQADADLLALPKRRVDSKAWVYPNFGGGQIAIPLRSADKREAADPETMLKDFMTFCHIVEPPIIELGLNST